MPIYKSPVEDYQFLLHHYLKISGQADLASCADLTADFTGELLSSAARFHEEVLHPINATGDLEGAQLVDGAVVTPAGFRQAWKLHSEGGWHRLSLPESIGGAGLPPALSVAIEEIGIATGHSFKMYGGFCAPAAYMLDILGDDWIRAHVVPRLVAGDWSATMCLTESHCGTDLRQIRTRAYPQADGTWKLSGTKIFISGGDHDMTDNIVHVVLAKVADAQGKFADDLSAVHVFLVSKRQIDPSTGQLGDRNRLGVRSLEHKMGIEASATCVLDFDGAVAWRIAGTGSGTAANMAAMFILMNYARLGTAISGIAYADLAYQNAAAYARERQSGRSPGGAKAPQLPADPIVVHADIRRLLLESRAFAEGARALALRIALYQSEAVAAGDAQRREAANDMVDMMTPVMKAFFTDKGYEAANACQQVLGGHGYVRDWGLEQMVRNARIGQIYEGANGVQAIDLVTRKLCMHGGRRIARFRDTVQDSVQRARSRPALVPLCDRLARGLEQLAVAHEALDRQSAESPHALPAAAYDMLTAYGIVAVGWAWLDVAYACMDLPADAPVETAHAKLQLARLWMERQMPCVSALVQRIEQGPQALMALDDARV